MIARLLLSPSIEKIRAEIRQILASHFQDVRMEHPDILYFEQNSKLGIGEARKITGHFFLKPFLASKAVIIEEAGDLTQQAQNALLKTIEEPPREAILILGASSDANLLPTILSRCQITRLHDKEKLAKNNYTEDIEKLLSEKIEQRFEYIEKLKEREEFLHSLMSYFHQDLKSKIGNAKFLKELLQTEQWANQNVNIRAILEYLMLVIPTKV